jgi:3-oxoacyl-[acyl-carrier-protein] synthase-3
MTISLQSVPQVAASQQLAAVIRGTGSGIPQQVLHNKDFPAQLETSDEWIWPRTGIRERRVAAPGETALTLALTASRKALQAADLSAQDIDLIVFATVTPDAMVPATACRLQAALGCRAIGAFDLSAACTGYIYGLAIGWQFIRGGLCRHVLVVGSEVLSRVQDYTDRSSCILFGDGAGAAVLSAADEPGRGIRSVRLFADGGRGDLIRLPSIIPPEMQRAPGDLFRTPGCVPPAFLKLNGREVYKFAVLTLVDLIRQTLTGDNLTPDDIDLIVPHQMNQRIIDSSCRELGFPPERVVTNLDRYGNTAAASVPLALDEAIRSGRARPGDTLLLLGIGGGLSWGSAVLTL